MELWFNTYRKIEGDRTSALVFDFSTKDDITVSSPLIESHKAIQKITETHHGPYTLLASGGVDSQAMLYAWKTSGVQFSVVHYSYGNNIEDNDTLREFCTIHDIDYEIRYFDVEKFIKSIEYVEMAKQYDCASPHILTYVKLVSMHDETCIMAGNYIDNYTASLNYTILGLDRYRQISKENFVPFFLCCTPELAYSFIDNYNNTPDDFTNRGYYKKVLAYELSDFPVISQSNKLSGFEAFKDKYDTRKIDGRIKLKWGAMPSKRPFDIIYRYGLFDVLPLGFYSESTIIIHNKWQQLSKDK